MATGRSMRIGVSPWVTLGGFSLAALVLVASQTRAVQASVDLLAHWAAEGNTDDTSGNGHHGTLMNGAGFGAGVNGGTAFSLDGVDDYVGINNSLGNGAAAITVEAWIKPGALPSVGTSDYIVASDDAGSFSEPSLFSLSINRHGPVSYLPSSMTGFSVSFGIRAVGQPEVHAALGYPDVWYYASYWWGSAIATNPSEVAVGQWAHLVGVYDGTETRLYINGRLAATSALQPDGANRSVTGPLVTTPVPRRIGRPSYDADPTYGSFTGLIDNVKIYGRALEECEIPQSAEGPCEPEDTTAPEIATPNEVTAEATSASGAAVSYIVSAVDDVDGAVTPECSPASGATFALGVTTVTCTAADEAGNTSEETFDVTVEDSTVPTLAGVPGDIEAEATSAAGAVVTYATPTATDLVAGPVAVTCSPASGSSFPTGTTPVTCTAEDSAGNQSVGSFDVTVNDVTTPGRMRGQGFISEAGTRYEFDFDVRERAQGGERGYLGLELREQRPPGRGLGDGDDDESGRGRGRPRAGRFVARAVTFVAFSDDPSYRPGRPRQPQVDTVLFSGVGEWNGAGGYSFEVFAADHGEPGRHRESVRITILDAGGAVVADVEGDLDGGNVQSVRIRH